ncbi:MAG TPA: glycoside hydrolase family 130 protein [Silvibacterium sp.]|nr:glycoside hydrolase family 130 protein [Silvibacterium sp.]
MRLRRSRLLDLLRMSLILLTACVVDAHVAEAQTPVIQQPHERQWQIGPFVRPPEGDPVIEPRPQSTFVDPISGKTVHWEVLHTFNPAAIVRNGKIYVLYRAEDDTGVNQIGGHTSRLGLAESQDGIHFKRLPVPVLFPADDSQKEREWPGGVEDPRIVESEDGTYVLTYTQWNRITYSVGIATSRDLIHWTKFGPAFLDAAGGKYASLKYKSAGIVTQIKDGRLLAARIDDRYWMYWGEGEIHLATSADLLHWTPVEGKDGRVLVVLGKRPGHFDSGFPEVGPPPLLTDRGILVMNNGKNDPQDGDPELGPNAYAAGQALFAPDDPSRLLGRADKPFLKPEMPFEKTGQYAAGTTFAEGLVAFKGKWFLYYGCADSLVGVAVADLQ